ncbi:unnamed protein product, partial [Allacma fusca]
MVLFHFLHSCSLHHSPALSPGSNGNLSGEGQVWDGGQVWVEFGMEVKCGSSLGWRSSVGQVWDGGQVWVKFGME